MGQHANQPNDISTITTKRVQWQSSNNDFLFFGSRQDPKNEKSFVAALFVTICQASLVFLFRAQCPLKLKSKFLYRDSLSQIKEEKKELNREN